MRVCLGVLLKLKYVNVMFSICWCRQSNTELPVHLKTSVGHSFFFLMTEFHNLCVFVVSS